MDSTLSIIIVISSECINPQYQSDLYERLDELTIMIFNDCCEYGDLSSRQDDGHLLRVVRPKGVGASAKTFFCNTISHLFDFFEFIEDFNNSDEYKEASNIIIVPGGTFFPRTPVHLKKWSETLGAHIREFPEMFSLEETREDLVSIIPIVSAFDLKTDQGTPVLVLNKDWFLRNKNIIKNKVSESNKYSDLVDAVVQQKNIDLKNQDRDQYKQGAQFIRSLIPKSSGEEAQARCILDQDEASEFYRRSKKFWLRTFPEKKVENLQFTSNTEKYKPMIVSEGFLKGLTEIVICTPASGVNFFFKLKTLVNDCLKSVKFHLIFFDYNRAQLNYHQQQLAAVTKDQIAQNLGISGPLLDDVWLAFQYSTQDYIYCDLWENPNAISNLAGGLCEKSHSQSILCIFDVSNIQYYSSSVFSYDGYSRFKMMYRAISSLRDKFENIFISGETPWGGLYNKSNDGLRNNYIEALMEIDDGACWLSQSQRYNLGTVVFEKNFDIYINPILEQFDLFIYKMNEEQKKYSENVRNHLKEIHTFSLEGGRFLPPTEVYRLCKEQMNTITKKPIFLLIENIGVNVYLFKRKTKVSLRYPQQWDDQKEIPLILDRKDGISIINSTNKCTKIQICSL